MVSIIGTPTSMTGLQPQGSMYPHNITLALSGLDCFNAKLGMCLLLVLCLSLALCLYLPLFNVFCYFYGWYLQY